MKAKLCKTQSGICKSLGTVLRTSVFYLAALSNSHLALAKDLQESPLSLSLNTSLQYRVGAQQHQVVITQYGILNKATVNQINETSNQAHVTQYGTNNEAALFQYGANNVVNLLQQGNNNQAHILQQGDGNTANISQAGEQTFTVQQIGNGIEVNVTFYKQ
ncbi:curlin subunit CsgB [Pseudoalteromonas spongiae]|jgi:minor curlin subunit|nr:curlin subunit CsgB [Pseudoalteromonas spongiae]